MNHLGAFGVYLCTFYVHLSLSGDGIPFYGFGAFEAWFEAKEVFLIVRRDDVLCVPAATTSQRYLTYSAKKEKLIAITVTGQWYLT